MKCAFSVLLIFVLAAVAIAEPYGPTLNEVVNFYQVTRKFYTLTRLLDEENIEIRLGMKKREVEEYAARSKKYRLTSTKNSIYKFESKEIGFQELAFRVSFAKGVVVMISTYNNNDFEFNNTDLTGLKALKQWRVNECWVRQNFVDVNSFENGYDFALGTESNIPIDQNDPCMGSNRANITIGRPGLLYPKHVKQ